MGSRLSRKRTRVVWLVVVLVVVAGGAGAWLVLTPSSAEEPPESMTAFATVDTQRDTVSATGTVEPAKRADLTFAVSGEVTDVRVAEGATVTAGQVLATVDDELLAAEVDAAESELDAAEAKRDDQTAAGASDTQLAAASAEIAAASSRLTAAEESLDQAELKATIAGTVVAVELAVGDQVGSGSDPDPGNGTAPTGDDESTAAITVVSTNRYAVEARLSGVDVRRVKAGMAAEVTTTDLTEPAAGTVSTVGLVAEADESGAAAFPVTIDVTGEREDLYAGSSATVTVVVEERADVLTVPTQALHEDGESTYVNKIVDGKPVRTAVEVGAAYGPVTEILSGIEEGDEVELRAFSRKPGGGPDGEQGGPPEGGMMQVPEGGGPVFPGGDGGFKGGGR
jgi:multidrug efflux pump subunit AcrA (membrane-fusion protein)